MGTKEKLARLAAAALKGAAGLLGSRSRAYLLALFAEELAPVERLRIAGREVRFFCPGPIPVWRAETFFTKEPETLEWMDGFAENGVFWDIGANVGLYSLYAAFKRNMRVLSFEPESSNYYVLNRNILLNQLDGRVSAYCLAVNNARELGVLNLSDPKIGAAVHCFGEERSSLACGGMSSGVSLRQGMIGLSVDELVSDYSLPVPHHIKIDVDGNEDRIIAGAARTLARPELRSVLIELDTADKPYVANVTRRIEQAGLKLRSVKHAPMFDGGKFASIYNHIFVRDG